MRSEAPLENYSLPSWLKGKLAQSPRAELEQSALRVAISGAVLIYLLVYTLWDGGIVASELEVDIVALAFFTFSIVLTTRVINASSPSVARRLLGMVADNAVTSYCLIRMGEGGAVVLGVYLFVTFGNGFRYGRVYLHASQALGLIGFSVVLLVAPFWSRHLAIGIGLLIAMIVLPFYVGVLAERINEARRRADEANQAKGRFLANVSHEMRTPLNGVIAMADVLRETSLNESQTEIVETLGTSAHLLLAQIEDVLDMAKIEAGRVQIERRPFDLAHLISSTAKVVSPQARLKGLTLHVSLGDGCARWFEGDSHHLRQVLLNLLANAIKFTDRGEVELTATLEISDSAGAVILFKVRDTGIGIPPDKQAIIFEPFTQADDSITRLYGGTGLGTTIARQLVLLMGGTIGLSSTPGVGSEFWCRIPFPFSTPTSQSDSNEASQVETKTTDKQARIRPNNIRILVAEDNPTNRRVAELVLRGHGYQCTLVTNGDEALDELESGAYNLALFDLSMPIVSGLEALKLYRFSTKNPIPVLILSANVTTDVISDCQRAGAAEFIPKPIRPEALIEAIERHLGDSVEAQEANGQTRPPSPARPPLRLVESSPIDHQVLDDLARLSPDPTFLSRLLNGFRTDVTRLVGEFNQALVARHYQALKDSAHALKGGAGSIGARDLVALAGQIEKASTESLELRGEEFERELRQAIEDCLAELDRYLASESARTMTGG